MGGNPVRKPVLYAALVAVVSVGAVLVWYFASGQHAGSSVVVGDPVHVLCALESTSDGQTRVEDLIVVSADGRNGSLIYVPQELWVQSPGGTAGRLRDWVAAGDWATCCTLVGSFLGIKVEGYLVLTDEAVAEFLAAFGGIAVSIPLPVAEQVTGSATVEPVAGLQTLEARQALEYVWGESANETRSDRAGRLLTGLLEAAGRSDVLRADPGGRMIRSPSWSDGSNLRMRRLAEVWWALVASGPAAVSAADVPTRTVVRDGEPRLVPMVVETERLVASLIRGLDLLTPSEITVAVFNGNGVRLMAARASEYLQARGFLVSRIANADSFAYATSYVVILTEEPKAWILRDALPGAVKVVLPDGFEQHYEALRELVPAGTDLILVVGAGMEI